MATNEERIRNVMKRKRRPVGPGEMAAGLLEELEISRAEFTRRLAISRPQSTQLLSGKTSLSPDMALRLGRFFGNGPQLWLNLQRNRDLWDLLHLDNAIYDQIVPVEDLRKAA